MKNRSRCNLDLLLGESRAIEFSVLAVRSLIHDLGDDAEILSDALHCLISSGSFACPEDGCKAIALAMMFDASGKNYLHDEYDVLRNGVARDFLLQEIPALVPNEEVSGDA